jgi:hypothetical protein
MNVKIPRTVAQIGQYRQLVRNCKRTPTLATLNKIEDLLATGRSSVTTRHGIRERLSALESEVAKDKRFQAKVAAELVEPENPTPTKMKKHRRKLQQAISNRPGSKS